MRKTFMLFFMLYFLLFSTNLTFWNNQDYKSVKNNLLNYWNASVSVIDDMLWNLSKTELLKLKEKLSKRWDYSDELKYMKLKIDYLLSNDFNWNKIINHKSKKTFSNSYFSFNYDNEIKINNISDKEVKVVKDFPYSSINIDFIWRNFAYISFEQEIEVLKKWLLHSSFKKIFFQWREAYVIETNNYNRNIIQTFVLSEDKKNYFLITELTKNDKDIKQVYNSLRLFK